MDIKKLLCIAALGASVGLVGCGDDGTPTVDSGTPPTPDASADGSVVDAAPDGGTALPDLPPAQGGQPDPDDPDGIAIDPTTAVDSDYSCIDTAVQPAGGDDVSFDIRIEEFRDGNIVEGLCVKFWANNGFDTEDCDPSTDFVTDVDGVITVTAPSSSWYTIRIFPQPGPTPSLEIVGSLQVNEPAPAASGGSVEGNSVNRATLRLIPTVLGFPQAPGTGLVAGTVWDCVEDPTYGTFVRLYAADGSEILEGEEAADPHLRYFDGDDFPKDGQPWTHTDGLFAAANIPVGTPGELIMVEVWGRLTPGGEPRVIGCEQVPIVGDTVSLANIGAVRSDGPACPGLM